jgi:hypothetical protein
MRKLLKLIAVVATANLLCFWIVYGLLLATSQHVTLWQFLGFVPHQPPSNWQSSLIWVFAVLGAPGSIIMDGGASGMFLMVTASVLNSLIWGVGLGIPITALRKRMRRCAA